MRISKNFVTYGQQEEPSAFGFNPDLGVLDAEKAHTVIIIILK